MQNILHKKFSYSFNYATLIIVAVNVAAFILTGSGRNANFQYLFGLQPVLFTRAHYYWQLLTYMFMHGSWSHLLGNMIGLLFFGLYIERQLGSKEFLLFYLLCGILCGAASLAIYLAAGFYGVLLVGASGAVYAVLLLFAVIFPRSTVFIMGIVPAPAPILVAIYAGIAVFEQVFGMNQGVAHMTHLSGFAAAWIYCLARYGVNPLKVWKDALR
ncbi:MAG: rhomboid family intramembrane serine protease [Treponema sp.]|nr:rhomboid family intramembrane serine protease [Treponema sp.]MEE3434890.1 rhomboid family intramembrane serine protease [Treponema sp.]